MKTYHKIKSLWKREDKKPHNMMVGEFAEPEFEFLKDCDWVATEKIDGTNIRIMWDGDKVSFGGKTDNALKELDEALAKTIKTKEREQRMLRDRLFNI